MSGISARWLRGGDTDGARGGKILGIMPTPGGNIRGGGGKGDGDLWRLLYWANSFLVYGSSMGEKQGAEVTMCALLYLFLLLRNEPLSNMSWAIGSSVQKFPLPGLPGSLGILTKQSFRLRLCRIEFCHWGNFSL